MSAVASALPSLYKRMEADGATGYAVLSSSVDHGPDVAGESGATEVKRIVAKVSDFPDLACESLVDFDGAPHIVTSIRQTGGAAWFVGLSSEMDRCVSHFSGKRRRNGSLSNLSCTVPTLCIETGTNPTYGDASAENSSKSFILVVRRTEWPEVESPETGDTVDFSVDGSETVRANVCSVSDHRTHFLIRARVRW